MVFRTVCTWLILDQPTIEIRCLYHSVAPSHMLSLVQHNRRRIKRPMNAFMLFAKWDPKIRLCVTSSSVWSKYIRPTSRPRWVPLDLRYIPRVVSIRSTSGNSLKYISIFFVWTNHPRKTPKMLTARHSYCVLSEASMKHSFNIYFIDPCVRERREWNMDAYNFFFDLFGSLTCLV